MPLIEWSDSLSVGNDEIDTQHKKWIRMTNELHEALLNSAADKVREVALGSLKEMREYVRYHFDHEEEYMQRINYPDLAEHRKIHAVFYVRIIDYYNQVQEGKLVLNTQIMKTLRNWLEHHIMNEDKKYGDFAARRK